ncbi:MAG TPA: CHASE domain-containing protein [Gallionellaceae bacterium]
MPRVSIKQETLIRLAPWLVLAVCLLLTYLVWEVAHRNEVREAQIAFDAEVNDVHARIDARLNNYSQILKGAAGLFAASEAVSRQQFHAYVDKLQLEQNYPGIQGVGFARVVAASGRQQLVAAMRREGLAQFNIQPEGARDPYSAIVYLEPFDWRNQRAIGYDMYSEPIRRAAMERARDSGAPAISGKVVLVQETEKDVQSGFLMYMPVYRNHLPIDSLGERRNNLLGWVYEPFRMQNLMSKGVLGNFLVSVRDQLDIEIYDGDRPEKSAIMFDSAVGAPVAAANGQARFSSTRSLEYFGHTWTISVRSLPAFESRVTDGRSRIVIVGGVLVSLLLTLVAWLQSSTNTRAIRLAEKMTAKFGLALMQTITAMATVIEMRDPYTAGHQQRAAELARAIALEMGLHGEQLRGLYFAAMIYEVGKIQVPAEILSKPGKLDEVEYGLMQTHAQGGYDVLSEIDFSWPVAQIVRQHHERLDGSGYPDGLKGDEILLEARIIAVADVVEAMCSYRPYRPALGVDAALAEISAGRGTLYDTAVVDACLRLFRERGFDFLNEATGTARHT